MPSRKRIKWERNRALPRVFQADVRRLVEGETYKRGTWHAEVFGDARPLVLELGCGEGTYTVALARRDPARNLIGVDIKGHRFWRGAQAAHDAGLTNVAFLRTRIEFLDRSFVRDEVDELWLTFSDPRPKDDRGTKRITSPLYLAFYLSFLRPGGLVHIKSDSELVFEDARAGALANAYSVLLESRDVHCEPTGTFPKESAELLAFITPYEQRWIDEGRKIHYLSLRAPQRVDPARIEAALAALQGTRRMIEPSAEDSSRDASVGRNGSARGSDDR